MRLAVVSDIHGNLPALQAVLADAGRHGADGLIVAGDFCTGPQTGEVVRLLARRDNCWMIYGNRDRYLEGLGPGDPRWCSRQWAPLRWQSEHLGPEALALIAALPEQRVVALPGAAPIRVVHGSPRRLSEMLFPDRDPARLRLFEQAGFLAPGQGPPPLEAALAGVREPVLVCGHTHIAWQQRWSGGLALNPGSAGEPLEGDPRARYALLTWRGGCWQAELRAVAYDLDLIRAAYRESGLLAEGGPFAHACLRNIETGQNCSGRLVAHIERLAAEAGCAGGAVIPDEVWEQAVAGFDREA
ncbi:MAG TPA: metallophosphoesterase family protein [Anaerolineae bacterium]|nr:metallophosphoesterase family protein [Anaerolineae bacterium]HPL27879.1 metallophosphoesterase family protein [Anaerolineae bacterium]